ncbi:unnamed protein product [Amoebophrya sp. A25]|nr:unnamed protein product [Amoebophrya sp. A25]|eukprot:GSA25T00021474001.1
MSSSTTCMMPIRFRHDERDAHFDDSHRSARKTLQSGRDKLKILDKLCFEEQYETLVGPPREYASIVPPGATTRDRDRGGLDYDVDMRQDITEVAMQYGGCLVLLAGILLGCVPMRDWSDSNALFQSVETQLKVNRLDLVYGVVGPLTQALRTKWVDTAANGNHLVSELRGLHLREDMFLQHNTRVCVESYSALQKFSGQAGHDSSAQHTSRQVSPSFWLRRMSEHMESVYSHWRDMTYSAGKVDDRRKGVAMKSKKAARASKATTTSTTALSSSIAPSAVSALSNGTTATDFATASSKKASGRKTRAGPASSNNGDDDGNDKPTTASANTSMRKTTAKRTTDTSKTTDAPLKKRARKPPGLLLNRHFASASSQ